LLNTGFAIIDAYVLAGEISGNWSGIPHAVEQYEKVLRPFITKAQRLIPDSLGLIPSRS
jgi:hypothetical protein